MKERDAMPDLQVQARALGDPTRYKIFGYLRDATAGVGVAELTDHLGKNHNAVRQHLAKLVDAGLLRETTASSGGRGRPRLQYVIHPGALSRWGGEGPYQRLSVLLAEVVRTGASPEAVGRAAGQRIASGTAGDGIDTLTDLMQQNGFEPRTVRRGSAAEVVLEVCPFATVVSGDADTVCDIHLGMAHGIADVADGLVIDDLDRKDPAKASCRLRCHLDAS